MSRKRKQETVIVGDALSEAAALLKGRKFSPEELPIVDGAFARLGHVRPSDDVAECAAALLKIMSH